MTTQEYDKLKKAIMLLYYTKDENERKQVNGFLTNFCKLKKSWEMAGKLLLESDNVGILFFASQTLYLKITVLSQWDELQDLNKDQIFKLLIKLLKKKSIYTNTICLVRVVLCLTSIIVHCGGACSTELQQQDFSKKFQFFFPPAVTEEVSLYLIRFLPEQLPRVTTKMENMEINNVHNVIRKSVVSIMKYLFQVQKKYMPKEEKKEDEPDGSGGNLILKEGLVGKEESVRNIQRLLLGSYKSWVTFGVPLDIVFKSLLPLLFHLALNLKVGLNQHNTVNDDENNDTFLECLDCLEEIFLFSNSIEERFTNSFLFQMNEILKLVRNRYQKFFVTGKFQMCLGVVKMVTVYLDAQKKLLLKRGGDNFKELLRFLIKTMAMTFEIKADTMLQQMAVSEYRASLFHQIVKYFIDFAEILILLKVEKNSFLIELFLELYKKVCSFSRHFLFFDKKLDDHLSVVRMRIHGYVIEIREELVSSKLMYFIMQICGKEIVEFLRKNAKKLNFNEMETVFYSFFSIHEDITSLIKENDLIEKFVKWDLLQLDLFDKLSKKHVFFTRHTLINFVSYLSGEIEVDNTLKNWALDRFLKHFAFFTPDLIKSMGIVIPKKDKYSSQMEFNDITYLYKKDLVDAIENLTRNMQFCRNISYTENIIKAMLNLSTGEMVEEQFKIAVFGCLSIIVKELQLNSYFSKYNSIVRHIIIRLFLSTERKLNLEENEENGLKVINEFKKFDSFFREFNEPDEIIIIRTFFKKEVIKVGKEENVREVEIWKIIPAALQKYNNNNSVVRVVFRFLRNLLTPIGFPDFEKKKRFNQQIKEIPKSREVTLLKEKSNKIRNEVLMSLLKMATQFFMQKQSPYSLHFISFYFDNDYHDKAIESILEKVIPMTVKKILQEASKNEEGNFNPELLNYFLDFIIKLIKQKPSYFEKREKLFISICNDFLFKYQSIFFHQSKTVMLKVIKVPQLVFSAYPQYVHKISFMLIKNIIETLITKMSFPDPRTLTGLFWQYIVIGGPSSKMSTRNSFQVFLSSTLCGIGIPPKKVNMYVMKLLKAKNHGDFVQEFHWCLLEWKKFMIKIILL